MKFAQVKNILLVCCGQGFNREYRGHYNRYKVIIDGVPIEKIYSKDELKNLAYWSTRSNVMAMTTWGQSQEFEAELSIGRLLKADEKYLNKKEQWGEYTRDLISKFEVIY